MKRILALLLLVLAPQRVSAELSNDQKVKCANAYEQAQRTRNSGLFRASREQLLICTEDACPTVLRSECVKWLGELDAAMPTVLVVAKDDQGNELADVSVSVDGTKLVDRLDGKALAVDPGTRTFRFARAGSDPIERKVLVREGEKRRVVNVTFAASTPPSPAVPEQPKNSSSAVPAATWILGGVGVVALGVSVPMYASYFKQKATLDDKPCAAQSTCDPDEVAPVKRQLIYANIASAVSVVALGTALIVWAAAPSSSPSVSAGIAPTPGGGAGAVRIVV